MTRNYYVANAIAGFAFGWTIGLPWCLAAVLAFAIVSSVVLWLLSRHNEIAKARVLP